VNPAIDIIESQKKPLFRLSEKQEDILARVLTVLFFPILIPVILVLGYILTFVFIGAIYLGPMLGLIIMALLWPFFKIFRIPESATSKIQIGIFAITCPLGVFFMVSTLWR
jgi:hypothetical protein